MTTTMRPTRKLVFRLLVCGASIVVTLCFLEVAVRLFSSQGYSLLVKDSIVGQRYRAGYQGKQFIPESEQQVDLRFNRLGYRGPEVPEDKPAGVRRVAVLGDSFVAAVAVDEANTMCAQLQRLLQKQTDQPWQVLNFGVSGNSTGQSLLTWRHFARNFAPDLVILCFYNGNDLAENMPGISSAHRQYFHLDEQGKLVLDPLSEGRASLSRWLSEHSHFYVWQKHRMRVLRDKFRSTAKVLPPGFQILNSQPPEQFEQAWQVTEQILATLDREVEETGAEFVLVSIAAHEQMDPSRWQELVETVGTEQAATFDPDYPEKRLSQICQKHNIRWHALVDDFRKQSEELHFQSEGHWNERGNQLAAESIFEYLTTHHVAGLNDEIEPAMR